jgi:hypothetical protein
LQDIAEMHSRHAPATHPHRDTRAATIGVIAKPVSARDIRRVVANAGNRQICDRVHIVVRLLSAAAAPPGDGGGTDHCTRPLRRVKSLGLLRCRVRPDAPCDLFSFAMPIAA